MIDKLVVKGNFNGIKPGMLVSLDKNSIDIRHDMAGLALDMEPEDVGLVLETTFWESHLGDDQLHLSPVVIVLVRGRKAMIIPKYLRESTFASDCNDITIVNYSTYDLPDL